MSLEREELLAGLGIPQLHVSVIATGGNAFSIGTKGDAGQPPAWPSFAGDEILARLHIPNLYSLIAKGRGQTLTIGAIGHRAHGISWAGEAARFGTMDCIPELNRSILTGR